MMQLRINGSRSQHIWLRKPTYLIGRSAACNIRIADQHLRPVHACLKVEKDAVRLLRQDDAPIQINGVALEAEAWLGHGDAITLGESRLTVVDPALEASKAGAEQSTGTEAENGPTIEGGPTSDDFRWCLQGVSSALDGRSYEINQSVLVGRAMDCDIQLGEAHLSRRHARLTPSHKGLELEDLDSANGTFVNGRRIKRIVLSGGDEVSLDTLKFRVRRLTSSDRGGETQVRAAPTEPVLRPARPALPTAIEVQHATLRRLREERGQQHSGGTSGHRLRSGWLAVAVIALFGVLWGASSFFQTSIPG